MQLSRQRAHIADLSSALSVYSDYTADYVGLSFKPSTHKGDAALRYIATNLHVHRLLVYRSPLAAVALGGRRRTLATLGRLAPRRPRPRPRLALLHVYSRNIFGPRWFAGATLAGRWWRPLGFL